MKKIFILMSMIVCLLLSSCASTSRSGYEILPEQKTSYSVEIGNIEVNVEHIEEDVLAAQLSQIMESMLAFNGSSDSEKLSLDVQINQRAYYENITQYNSIYTIYTLTDENGNCVLKNGIYKKTTDSIASSVLQCKLSEIMSNSIKSFILKSGRINPKKTGGIKNSK